jgi:cyclic pyranopterin phosphate synthase
MVDIGGKLPAKERVALAQAIVQFPDGLLAKIIADGTNKKGDIFAVKIAKGKWKKGGKIPFFWQVSRVGGILGAKSVPQLIPLCHSVPLSSVLIQFLLDLANDQIVVQCRAKAVDAKTGVEMEAMASGGGRRMIHVLILVKVGCSLAALIIYDMTKATSLGILIGQVKLLGKRGGKRDFGQTELVDNKEEK